MTTYKTLEVLVEENLEVIREEGSQRPYKVVNGNGEPIYVLANSAGNAALAACKVETCTKKQIQTATLNLLLKKAQAEE